MQIIKEKSTLSFMRRMTLLQRVIFRFNHKLLDWRNRLLIIRKESEARLLGKRFKCCALSGESNYNICINADMSVSCNCNDIYGDGRLGNLRRQTFDEVFAGDKAMQMRQSLMAGRLPITNCRSCPELIMVSEAVARNAVKEFALPKLGIMMENTAACNLSCLGCWRSFRSMEREQMSLEDLRTVAKTLRQIGCKKLAYFSLGEPFLSKRILQELEIIREVMPDLVVHTSTNGVMIDTDAKRDAAMLMNCITFSLDGCSQETAEKYQVGIDFDAAYENMCRLVAHRERYCPDGGPLIIWKYVVFNWNDLPEHLEEVQRLACKANVDVLQFCGTGNPIHAISWRYKTAPYWRRLAPINGNIRLVFLRNVQEKYAAVWES